MNTDYVRVASKAAPIYSVYIANSAGLNITVDAVVTELKLSENERELAQRANIELRNCYSDDYLLSELVNVHDTVFIYANDGDECKEVFRAKNTETDRAKSLCLLVMIILYICKEARTAGIILPEKAQKMFLMIFAGHGALT